jgi:hypothetical protein
MPIDCNPKPGRLLARALVAVAPAVPLAATAARDATPSTRLDA